MGTLLNTSKQIVDNSLSMLDGMMNSPFNKFLSETPILVDYYNINDTFSTADTGLGTIDSRKGSESPDRFNKISDFPVYGLKQLIPDISEGEGELLDLSVEGEVTVLPNTIKPCPGDYFCYKFLNREITFIINDFAMTTIQSNSYYRLVISMKSIDNPGYAKELDKQVVETFVTDLTTVGTNAKCLIKSTLQARLDLINRKLVRLRDGYISTFYDARYNSIIFRDVSLGDDDIHINLYDQFLTNFIQTNAILKNTDSSILVNYDGGNNFRARYNKTFFRNIENREKTTMKPLLFSPTSLPTSQNPFSYYGEEVFFCMELYKDDVVHYTPRKNEYISHKLIEAISNNVVDANTSLFEAIIIHYFNADILNVVNDDELESLDMVVLEYTQEYLYQTPIVLFILEQMVSFLKQS